MNNTSWFAVDHKGLAKLIEHRGKVFLIHELLQNALDTNCTSVGIALEPCKDSPHCILVVKDDDPDGFKDIAHAYTLFAESEKKVDPTKRGRFNFGEKIVLALCDEAIIMSTRSAVEFCSDGTRRTLRKRTSEGTVFQAKVRMTRAEYAEVCREIKRILPPPNVHVTFNMERLEAPAPLRTVTATLPTEVADKEGNLRPTQRKTEVQLFPSEGPGWLYEMGIPVVEISGPWHVNVMQKVPLNLQRDNVRPAYLRDLRVNVLNCMWDRLSEEETTKPWVGDALADPHIAPEAVQAVVTKRFGEKVVSADPSDTEAMNRAAASGYTVVGGRTFSKEQWENVRKAGAIKPAGTVFPTPKPYSDDPDAPPVDVIPESEWKRSMREVAVLAERLAWECMQTKLTVTYVRTSNRFAACYAPGRLDFNMVRLGYRWFDNWRNNLVSVLDLLIHEFAHHYESNHLSEKYYDALSNLGGKMAYLALTEPALFEVNI